MTIILDDETIHTLLLAGLLYARIERGEVHYSLTHAGRVLLQRAI